MSEVAGRNVWLANMDALGARGGSSGEPAQTADNQSMTDIFRDGLGIDIYMYLCIQIFPRKNVRFKKIFARDLGQERTRARLLYLTQTGGHQVFSTRKDDPASRFLTNRGLETHLLRPSVSPPRHHLGLRRDRKIHTTGPSKPLGYYPSKHTRCN